jgi:hypothetical protein
MKGTRTLAIACAAGIAGILLAGCSQRTSGSGVGPVFTTVSGLAAKLTKGTDELTSGRGVLHLKAGALNQTSTFSEQLAKGDVLAMDDIVNTTYQGKTTELHMIIVGGKVYVDRSGSTSKPWVVATPDSSDPVVAQLAQNVADTLGQTGMHQYIVMVASAKQLKVIGPDKVDGVPATHYGLTIDTRTAAAKLPKSQGQQMQAAIDAGVDSIPMELWVDGKGRSIKLTDKVSAQGSTASVELLLSHFDEKVSISAPPPDKVSSS